jgi:hypothetical protein
MMIPSEGGCTRGVNCAGDAEKQDPYYQEAAAEDWVNAPPMQPYDPCEACIAMQAAALAYQAAAQAQQWVQSNTIAGERTVEGGSANETGGGSSLAQVGEEALRWVVKGGTACLLSRICTSVASVVLPPAAIGTAGLLIPCDTCAPSHPDYPSGSREALKEEYIDYRGSTSVANPNRNAAERAAKRDANIPMNAPQVGEPEVGQDANGNPMITRKYDMGPGLSPRTVSEHPAGHTFPDGTEIPPHFHGEGSKVHEVY